MKKRDKNVAGILALFFGWLGVHRYYLGQNDKGLFYTLGAGLILWGGRIPFIGILMKFLWVPLVLIVSLVDAISLFAMETRDFDEKYNGVPKTDWREERRERREARRQKRHAHSEQQENRRKTVNRRPTPKHNPYKKSGVKKFNEFDYAGAIGDFKKSLEIAPKDIASHFNLACAYSLTEKSNLAFQHLDTAVSLGFKDFDKIRNHHALAYLRIQPAFEEFAANGFRLQEKSDPSENEKEDLLQSQPDLLDQLKKLGELRNKGLLTELEFEQQKKKLLSE